MPNGHHPGQEFDLSVDWGTRFINGYGWPRSRAIPPLQSTMNPPYRSLAMCPVRHGGSGESTWLAALGALVVCLALGSARGAGVSPASTPAAPRLLGGEEAIRALGSRLPAVARAHRRSPDELALQFRVDPTLSVDPAGRLLHSDPAPQGLLPPSAGSGAGSPVPLEDTFRLHSRPGSQRIVYLDFDGHFISGTIWNAYYFSGHDLLAPPFDLDGQPDSFSDEERRRIQEIWSRVAEDYAPFDVDITTELASEDQIHRTDAVDAEFGTRVLVSPLASYFGDYGGMAWVGVFSASGVTHSYYQPALVFPERLNGAAPKYVADSVSHEAGHTLGLSHDGTAWETYHEGHGTGETGWAPIMGAAYYRNLSQWSRGEYPGANNKEDDLAVMQNHGLSLRPDDHGNESATGTRLPGGGRLDAEGVLESGSDVDVFVFDVDAGFLKVSVLPVRVGPNVDLMAELRDGSGSLVVADNPPESLGASISLAVPAGTYSLSVSGVGKAANGAHLGYSSYGSVGYYFIRGTSGGVPPSPPIAMGQSLRTDEDTATVVTLSASDAEGGVLTYTVVTPPKLGVLTGTPPHLTYSPHADANGIDTFAFKAANGVGESAEAWVTVEVVPVNDPPVASPQIVSTDEDTPISIRLTGSDPEAAELNYTIIRPPTRGVLHGTAPDLTYTPNLNETGMDTFTFRVGDGVVESTEMEVAIEIRPMNDAPVAEGVVVTTEEDRAVGVRLSGRDVEGSPLAHVIVAIPNHGVLSGVPPELTYTPNPDATGTDSFTFKVNDGVADSPEATVTIEIAPVNDVPVARMTLTPQSGEAPLSVAFDGSGSSDVDGTISGVVWDFGEGSRGTDVMAWHTYTEPGTYGVTLTVTDTHGAVGFVRGVVEVAPNPSQRLCVRAIDLSILPGPRGNSVVARVRVTDRNGVVQPGVTVAGTFSGRIPRTIMARTDIDGMAVLTSVARKIPGAAVFRLEALSKKGFVHDAAFDAAVESSIEVPIWERGVELGARE